MDKKRQTITLTRDFYNATKWMKDENRLEFYDTVFRSLFDNKDIDFEKVKSENVASALAILSPALSAITSKYENRVGKKLKSTPSPFLCSQGSIEMERNGTNLSEPATSYLNNKLNNNIYNIYTNKQTKEKTIKENKVTTELNAQNEDKQSGENHDNGEQKNNQTKTQDPCDFELTSENLNKAQFYCSVLQDKSECIADNFVKARFLELAQRLCQEQTPLKIKGVYTSPDEILNKLVNLFRCEPETSNKQLIEVFEYFDEKVETGTIKNTYKYLISILYNIAREGPFSTAPQIQQKQPYTSFANQEIMQHNYTQEQINSIFNTNLDEIEI